MVGQCFFKNMMTRRSLLAGSQGEHRNTWSDLSSPSLQLCRLEIKSSDEKMKLLLAHDSEWHVFSVQHSCSNWEKFSRCKQRCVAQIDKKDGHFP